jgi:anti-anti-sigma factor
MFDPPNAFAVDRKRVGNQVRLAPHGELDIATAFSLESSLRAHAVKGAHVVVDLSGLTFVDSSAINLLLGAARDAKRDGWTLTIVQGPPSVRRVFEVAGLLEILPFEQERTVA